MPGRSRCSLGCEISPFPFVPPTYAAEGTTESVSVGRQVRSGPVAATVVYEAVLIALLFN